VVSSDELVNNRG